MTLWIKNGGYSFHVFYVIMKRVPIVTNFERTIYRKFN